MIGERVVDGVLDRITDKEMGDTKCWHTMWGSNPGGFLMELWKEGKKEKEILKGRTEEVKRKEAGGGFETREECKKNRMKRK